MTGITSEANDFKFDISISNSWNFSAVQETVASALDKEFSESSKRFEQPVKDCFRFLFVIIVIFNKRNKLRDVRYIDNSSVNNP